MSVHDLCSYVGCAVGEDGTCPQVPPPPRKPLLCRWGLHDWLVSPWEAVAKDGYNFRQFRVCRRCRLREERHRE